MTTKKKLLFLSAAILLAAAVFIGGNYRFIFPSRHFPGPEPLREVDKTVPAGATFYGLIDDLNVPTSTKASILTSIKGVFDASKLQAENALSLFFNKADDQLKKIVYNVNADQNLEITNASGTDWTSEIIDIPYETRIEAVGGTVDSSVYQALTDSGKDPRLAISLSEIFAWDVDFAFGVQKGDSFKVVYEARYLNGEYKMPGKILAAGFTNAGETFRAYYFQSDKTPAGYYDENGNSVEKMFLKFPLQYKYISTYFTYRRINPVTGVPDSHRAVDFAADYGTPVVSIGDGTAIDAGYRPLYGNKVVIRHNEEYATTYGHFERIAAGVKTGAHVKQGQIIGYVGATGEATGPHLHYEVRKFGTLVNPLSIKPPAGKPINSSDRGAFAKVMGGFAL